jgi:hypothetical protein
MENTNNALPVQVPLPTSDEKPNIQPQNQPPPGYYANPFPQQPGQPGQMNIGNLYYGYQHPGGYVPPHPNGYQPVPQNLPRQPAAAAEQVNEVELGARKVDQQLETGWYDCYKKFLYGVALYGLFKSSSADKEMAIIVAYACAKIASYMLFGFVLAMQFAYYKKEVSKAKCALIFAYMACALQIVRCWSYLSEAGELDPTNIGEKETNVSMAVLDVCFVIFAAIIPGGKVRDLLAKRLPALDAIPDPPLVEPEAFDI